MISFLFEMLAFSALRLPFKIFILVCFSAEIFLVCSLTMSCFLIKLNIFIIAVLLVFVC